MSKLKTIFTFSLNEWKIIGLAYFLLLKARFLLLLSPRRVVEQALKQSYRKIKPKRAFSKEELLRLFRIAWRYQPTKPNCLPTALAQQALLYRHGFPTRLWIGVKKWGETFQAHAWCEESPTLSEFNVIEPLRL